LQFTSTADIVLTAAVHSAARWSIQHGLYVAVGWRSQSICNSSATLKHFVSRKRKPVPVSSVSCIIGRTVETPTNYRVIVTSSNYSGAATNGRGTGPAQRAEKIVGRPLMFLALKVGLQLVVLVSAFVMISTVWYVSCLLFFCSRCPRAQPFVKVGARASVPHGVGATGYILKRFHLTEVFAKLWSRHLQ